MREGHFEQDSLPRRRPSLMVGLLTLPAINYGTSSALTFSVTPAFSQKGRELINQTANCRDLGRRRV